MVTDKEKFSGEGFQGCLVQESYREADEQEEEEWPR